MFSLNLCLSLSGNGLSSVAPTVHTTVITALGAGTFTFHPGSTSRSVLCLGSGGQGWSTTNFVGGGAGGLAIKAFGASEITYTTFVPTKNDQDGTSCQFYPQGDSDASNGCQAENGFEGGNGFGGNTGGAGTYGDTLHAGGAGGNQSASAGGGGGGAAGSTGDGANGANASGVTGGAGGVAGTGTFNSVAYQGAGGAGGNVGLAGVVGANYGAGGGGAGLGSASQGEAADGVIVVIETY